MNIIFEIIFSLGGLMCGCGSVLLFLKSFRRLKTWKTTTGTLVEWVGRQHDGKTFYYPKVQFVSLQGKQVVFMASAGSSRQSVSTGANISVLYDSNDPNQADLKTFMALWGASIVLAIIALSMAVVVVIMATDRH